MTNRGVCRHDGHTISAHIQVPRRPEIGDCPGFDPKPTKPADAQRTQTAQVMFDATGRLHVVAARSEADSADAHAVNGDLLAWGDYNEQMNEVEQELSDELGGIFG